MYARGSHPQAVAHRGLHFASPENSMSAFRLAVDAGADAVELDVHATADGHVVVHHDFEVRGHKANEVHRIAELEAGRLMNFPLADGSRIPLLTDVLAELPATIALFVEVKPPGIERLVVDCILGSPFPVDSCAIHSFDHRIARNAHAICSALATGILQVGYPLDAVEMLKGAHARDFWQHWEFVDVDITQQVHSASGRVVAWTCNDARGWARLSAIGVDAICTDRVDEFIAWRNATEVLAAD